MVIEPGRVAILGATGPTGRALAREFVARGVATRVVSRSHEHLQAAFEGVAVEHHAADLLDDAQARVAVTGCDLAVDCVGFPMDQMADHAKSARNVAGAAREAGARVLHVTSYWSYLPVAPDSLPLTESHPREGGNEAIAFRREAEDILREAGGAIVHLPDFYGPEVEVGTLQQALRELAADKTVNWIGTRDTPREYAYVPDAMRIVAELATHEEAYGEHWIVPGGGPLTLDNVVGIAKAHLGRPVFQRCARPWLLKVLALFVSELRGFLPMVPHYVQPIAYDGSKLRGLLGDLALTPYEKAIPVTLDALAAATAPPGEKE
jgi:nucleoside-diphosphate-sugar epimerase